MPNRMIDILLVEDNPAEIRLAQETLKDYKLQNSVHVVRDGEAGLRFLRQQGEFAGAPKPDLILLDIALPKLDGTEVLLQIREDERLKNLPVAVLIAATSDEKLLGKLNPSTECCIVKPMTLEGFLDAVRCFPGIGLSLVKIAAV